MPPLSLEELRRHADEFIEREDLDPAYRDYVAVVLNSEVWRESLATVPFERRLLLLPKCLRIEDKCPAPFDEFGLLCKQCGLCSIQDLQAEAERLGYAVLVAEGSALVMAIIQTGKIDAIVGVSCLSVLEKAFPYMESAAIPGVAIPLLQDDCKDTTIDLDWVWDVIHLTSDDRTYRLDLDALRTRSRCVVRAGRARRDRRAGQDADRADRPRVARQGRQALAAVPRGVRLQSACRTTRRRRCRPGLRKICVAVECFHKASLVHDDIEDDDALRYGEKTLHEQHGVPVALNVGDLLLGEGYRLIAECDAPPEAKAEMIRVAAAGHRTLCLGQGAELCWARDPEPLTSLEVLDIFRKKTAPAFEVALRLGAAYGGADEDVADVLTQLQRGARHRLPDPRRPGRSGRRRTPRTTSPRSGRRCRWPWPTSGPRTATRALVESVWRRTADRAADRSRAARLIREVGAEERCRGLLDSYKEEAVRSLAELENASLKGLLRRVIGKIFSVEVKGWCSEFEARNAPGRAAGAQAAG